MPMHKMRSQRPLSNQMTKILSFFHLDLEKLYYLWTSLLTSKSYITTSGPITKLFLFKKFIYQIGCRIKIILALCVLKLQSKEDEVKGRTANNQKPFKYLFPFIFFFCLIFNIWTLHFCFFHIPSTHPFENLSLKSAVGNNTHTQRIPKTDRFGIRTWKFKNGIFNLISWTWTN